MQESFSSFLADYLRRRMPLEREFNESDWLATTTGLAEHEERAARKMAELRQLHADPAEFASLKEWQSSGAITDPLELRQLELLLNAYAENQIAPDMIEDISRREQEIESLFTKFRAEYEGKPASENDLREVLVRENDSAKRRAAWEASKQIGAKAAPLVLALVEKRNEAARSLGFPDFYRMHLTLDQLDEAELDSILNELRHLTEAPFAQAKAELDVELAARFRMTPADLRPWHYADPFFQKAPSGPQLDLDRFYAGRDLIELAREFYDGIGLPVDDVLRRSDLFEREAKDQHACCMDIDRLGDVRVLANLRPNETWMETLLHECGHAAYSKYHDQELPYLLRDAAHTFTTEAIAMLMGRLTHSAAWLHRVMRLEKQQADRLAPELHRELSLGELIFARWGLVMYYFEREMYRDPKQDLGSLWWELVHELQLVTPPDGRVAPDWASKTHLATAPVYYHNYLLGALAASQISAALPPGGLAGNKAAGEFLRARVFAPGARYQWNEMLERATGEKLTAKHFAREFVS